MSVIPRFDVLSIYFSCSLILSSSLRPPLFSPSLSLIGVRVRGACGGLVAIVKFMAKSHNRLEGTSLASLSASYTVSEAACAIKAWQMGNSDSLIGRFTNSSRVPYKARRGKHRPLKQDKPRIETFRPSGVYSGSSDRVGFKAHAVFFPDMPCMTQPPLSSPPLSSPPLSLSEKNGWRNNVSHGGRENNASSLNLH